MSEPQCCRTQASVVLKQGRSWRRRRGPRQNQTRENLGAEGSLKSAAGSRRGKGVGLELGPQHFLRVLALESARDRADRCYNCRESLLARTHSFARQPGRESGKLEPLLAVESPTPPGLLAGFPCVAYRSLVIGFLFPSFLPPSDRDQLGERTGAVSWARPWTPLCAGLCCRPVAG